VLKEEWTRECGVVYCFVVVVVVDVDVDDDVEGHLGLGKREGVKGRMD
jgi:hypothetical protein